MSETLWQQVDDYFDEALVCEDAALSRAREESDRAGLPAISITPSQGKLLKILAETVGAKRILEIGTLGGYSAIWMARALAQGGELVTLEHSRKHAEVARANIAFAGLEKTVEVKEGRALDILPALAAPFDLVFIDADKPANSEYFKWALRLSRPGSLIVVDNVVRRGLIADAASEEAGVVGTRRMNELIRAEKRVSATAIQTVGAKGYDGFCLIRVSG